jgi:hypothetical protein
MNHPENITCILVVDYFALKKYEKQNQTAILILASFSLICTLFWHICMRICSLRTFLNFRRQKQTPCKNKHKFQNSEKTTVLPNSQAI